MSVIEAAGLYFVPPGTTINGSKYPDLRNNKLEFHMNVHQCAIFMQNSAPCHKTKIVSSFLNWRKIQVPDWPGNSMDLNPIKTCG